MPAPSLFALELAAGRPAAIRRLRAALRRHKGNLRATAAELGVGVTTLTDWRRRYPAVEQTIAELGLGRDGALKIARKRLAKRRREEKSKNLSDPY